MTCGEKHTGQCGKKHSRQAVLSPGPIRRPQPPMVSPVLHARPVPPVTLVTPVAPVAPVTPYLHLSNCRTCIAPVTPATRVTTFVPVTPAGLRHGSHTFLTCDTSRHVTLPSRRCSVTPPVTLLPAMLLHRAVGYCGIHYGMYQCTALCHFATGKRCCVGTRGRGCSCSVLWCTAPHHPVNTPLYFTKCTSLYRTVRQERVDERGPGCVDAAAARVPRSEAGDRRLPASVLCGVQVRYFLY